ncbi:hypothetical protein [Scytonema sp. NUACC26]|uniref:hypothetical protein n=1 Tax=Scytonema sp. NUACC26 TaxID=3140176 RepID=UPI0034DC2E6E
MTYQGAQKSVKQSSTQIKQSRVALSNLDCQIPADLTSSSKVTASSIPSKAERDSIRRKLFGNGGEEAYIQAQPLQRSQPAGLREEKQQRVARAKQTIKLLGNNITPSLNKHIFDALPTSGGQANPEEPSGLHAYNNQELPRGIEIEATEGSNNKVHTLTWRWKTGRKLKESTMFPKWMPKEHVNTLIALKFPETRQTEVQQDRLYPEAARTYIQRGLKIKLARAGDTVYPVCK